MSNNNKIDSFSKEQIEQFVAFCLGVTTRAVRVMKKDNYDRFQREAMGALCQQRGLTIESMLASYNVNPSVLCLDENLQKLEVIDNLVNIVKGKSKTDISLVEEMNLPDNHLLQFFESIFSSYGSDNYGYLDFSYDYEVSYDDLGEVEDFKTLPYLNVHLKDIFSKLDDYNPYRIPLFDEITKKRRTLLSICTEIENAFPELTKKPEKYYTNNMTLEIKFTDDSKNKIPRAMKNSIEVKEGDFFLEYLDITYKDTKIRYEDNTGRRKGICTFFKRKDIDISIKEDSSVEELFDYWKKIGNTICSDDPLYLEFIKKIHPIINSKKESEDEKHELIFTLSSIIIDSIAKGLRGSMSNAARKYVHPYTGFFGPVNKKHFEENWENKGDNIFTIGVLGRGKLYSLQSIAEK